jgi:hypothetical protein
MIFVKGKVLSSKPIPTDWDEDACLCQGKVPEDKRIDVIERIFDEKKQKHRWKVFLRYHIDCPIHGCDRKETA